MDSVGHSRRRFLMLTALTGTSAVLAACNAAPPAATTSITSEPGVATGEPAAAVAPTNVTVANNTALQGEISYLTYDLGPANESRKEAIKAFEAANPGAKVKLEVLPYGDMFQKLSAQMASGQSPDVIYGDFQLLTYALGGQLLDLSEQVRSDPLLSKPDLFTTSMTDPITAKYGTEKVYALPMGTWVPILYYNRDMFDAAGVSYPTEAWTWDDLRTAAKQLTKPAAQEYGFQISNRYDLLGWLWWSQKPQDFWAAPQIFPEKTLFKSQPGTRFFDLIHALAVEDKSMIPEAEASSYQIYGGGFGAGKVAMFSGGDWDAGWSFRDLQFKWGMSFIPMMDKGYRPALNTGVATNVIAASTKQPQLAWEFIRFLSLTEEGQRLIGKGAYETPVLASVANSDAILKPSWAVPGYDTRIKAAKLPGQMFTPYPLNLNLWEFSEKFLYPVMDQIEKGEIKSAEAVALLDKDGSPYFAGQQRPK